MPAVEHLGARQIFPGAFQAIAESDEMAQLAAVDPFLFYFLFGLGIHGFMIPGQEIEVWENP